MPTSPTWEDTLDDSPSWDDTEADESVPSFSESDLAAISEQARIKEEQRRNLGAIAGPGLMSPGGPEMDFARALYQEFPADVGEGLHTLMKPVEAVARPIFQALREATTPTTFGMTGEIPPELQPGETVIRGLEPSPDARGIIPSIRRAAAGMTTPGGLAILPAAGGGGAVARGVQGAFALGAGSAIPGAIQDLSEAQTPAEARGAATDLALSSLFAGTMGREAIRPTVSRAKPSTQRTQNAIQQKTEGTVPDLLQPEVTKEGAVEVPVSEGRSQAAEARVETTPEIQDFIRRYEALDLNLRTPDAEAAGMAVKSVSDLQGLVDANNRFKDGLRTFREEIKAETDVSKKQAMISQLGKYGGVQYAREAIEAATGIGSVKRPDSPLNYRTNPEVREWLSQNADSIWGGENLKSIKAELESAKAEPAKPIGGEPVEKAQTKEVLEQPGITTEQVPALGYLPRQSEIAGMGEPSMPPTVETVRAQRRAEARSGVPSWVREEMQRRGLSTGRIFNDIDLGNPSIRAAIEADPTLTRQQKDSLLKTGSLDEPTMFPLEGENVQMRKSAERATTAPAIPEPVQQRIATAEESFYRQQSMAKVEDAVSTMSDSDLVSVPRDSNLYTAAKLEQANRLFKAGKNDEGYNVFVELEKEGTRLGQLINQFKLLKSTRPEEVVRVINKTLEKAGKDPLPKPAEEAAIKTASKSKEADRKLEEATDEWAKSPTPENAAKAEQSLLDANEAGLELQRFVSKYQPRSTSSIIKSVLQGNLLTPISEVANIVGNMAFLPFRAATRGAAASMDVLNNYLTKTPRQITVQPIRGTAEALKGFGRGAAKIPDVFIRGTGDVIKGETRAGLHPVNAWINQFAKNPEMPTTGGKLTLKDRLNLAIEGTFGVPAEAMLRGLGAGDVAFKEAAKARATATELSLANVPKDQWAFAQKFPELFLTPEAMQRIQTDTLQAVFQRPSKTLSLVTNWLRGKGDFVDLLAATVAPYKLTPWNIIGEILSYNPLIAAARSVNSSRLKNPREARLNAGKFVVGSMVTAAGWWLYKNGLMSPSLDQRDEAQKARVLAGEVMPPNHINLSGLKRRLEGGDPTYKPGDETIDVFRAGGLAGSMFYMTANIGRDFERMPEVADSEVWGAILRQSTLEQARFGMNQSFLSGVEGLLSAVREGNTDNYIRQWGNTVASIPLPNTLTVMSRASREYKPDFREDTFRKQMENIVRNKLGIANLDDYLPLKRGLWGEPMRETPEGRNAIMYHFFDVFKNKQVTSDPVPLELFRLWRKTGDTRVIPSLPEKSLTIGRNTYAINTAQQSRYAELVGKSRRRIVDAVVVNPEFHKLPDEAKIKLLDKVYRAGMDHGKVQFWQEFGGTLQAKPERAGFNP